VFKALATVYREERQGRATVCFSALRSLAAARILFFPNVISQFNSMSIMDKLHHPTRKHDPLYFIAHTYYMSRQFNIRQRLDVALSHHLYESLTFNCNYAKQAYRSNGILLWRRSFDDLHFTICLTASPDNRHEGDLTVVLSVNDNILCRMSFCYLNASIFGQPRATTMLISRNQTDRTSVREAFDRHFKQNSPQFFCLSAVCGIAMMNEFRTIFAIRHDAQIAYEEPLHSNFRNSYTALWEKFAAAEINQHVYMLDVPLTLRPIGLVNRSHRRRARDRRGYWDEIVQSSHDSMAQYRRHPYSEPDAETPSLGGERRSVIHSKEASAVVEKPAPRARDPNGIAAREFGAPAAQQPK
jgi:uncharacterized protein VirK/YbjX